MNVLLWLMYCTASFSITAQTETVSVYFDFNSAQLNGQATHVIHELNKRLVSEENLFVDEVLGFTDTVGTVEYNESLAMSRIESVLNILDRKTNPSGQRETCITITGEKYGIDSNYTDSAYRRVDILLLKPSSFDSKINSRSVRLTHQEQFQKLTFLMENFAADTSLQEVLIRLAIRYYPNEDRHYNVYEDELKRLYTFMHDNPTIHAHIRGHVCCGHDYALSSNRAFKVYKYLTSRGIDKGRLSFKGYSNTKPVVYPEVTEYDKLQNRRVDVVFTKK